MKKLLFLMMLCVSFPSFSQMIDLMGSLGVQGAITTGEVESVGRGLSVLKQNQIIGDLTQTAMEIKTQYMGSYSGVQKSSVMGNPFGGLDWDLGSFSDNLFYIQLNQIDERTCARLLSARLSAVETELNGISGSKSCTDNNQIRFIFD